MAHPVVHAEIRSSDPDATRAFFGELFAWSYSDGAYPGYTFVDTGAEGALPTAISPLQGDSDVVLFFVGVHPETDMERGADFAGLITAVACGDELRCGGQLAAFHAASV